MSIESQISELKRRIKKYLKYIKELEDLYNATDEDYKKIEERIQIKEVSYDITRSGKWKGCLKDEGERLKGSIISDLIKDQERTVKFMSDIMVTIDNLYKLIQECEEEIEELEAMLYSPSEPEM